MSKQTYGDLETQCTKKIHAHSEDETRGDDKERVEDQSEIDDTSWKCGLDSCGIGPFHFNGFSCTKTEHVVFGPEGEKVQEVSSSRRKKDASGCSCGVAFWKTP